MKCSFLRRGRAAASIAIGAGAMVMASGLPATAAPARPAEQARPATAAQPATGPAWPSVLVNCRRHGVVMPRTFILTCADANDFLTNLHWVSWHAVAYGSGIEHINSCMPSCAAGHFRRFPVLITVWRARVRGHLREFKFTRLTAIYPHRRPLRFNSHGHRHHPLTFTWHV